MAAQPLTAAGCTWHNQIALSTLVDVVAKTARPQLAGMVHGAVQLVGIGAPFRRGRDPLGCQLSVPGHVMLVRMVAFSGRVRRWREDKPGGLAVVDIPAGLVADLGGRRQMRVTGNLNGTPFTGSTMLVAGGGLCVGVSKAALTAAKAVVGDEVQLSITASSS